MIKAVSFDFWFTIVSINKEMDNRNNEIRKESLEKLFNQYGIPIEPEDIIPKLLQAKKYLLKMKKEQGNVDFSNRHIEVPYVFEFMSPEIPTYLSRSKPILKEKLLDAFSEILAEAVVLHKPPIIPYVNAAVECVKKLGFKAGIVSNTGFTGGKSLRKVLDHYGILHYFDTTIFSDEVGLQKPNPKIFEILTNRLELDSHEIVHVGDTIFSDIVGARKAGLHEGVLYLGAFDDTYQERNLKDDFKEFQPRYVIDDYRDFPGVLGAILNGESSYHLIRNKKMRKRLGLDKILNS